MLSSRAASEMRPPRPSVVEASEKLNDAGQAAEATKAGKLSRVEHRKENFRR